MLHLKQLAFFYIAISSFVCFAAAQARYRLPYLSVAKRTCPRATQIIVLSGQGSPNVGGYGLLQGTVESIKAAIPGSRNVSLPYPKDVEDTTYKINVATQNLDAYLPKFAEQCPNTPIVILGYSAGAIATMNAYCGGIRPWNEGPKIPTSYSSRVIATILYGDETFATNQPYNRGTCTRGAPYVPRSNTADCGVWRQNIRSYCNADDPQCCAGGTDQEEHYVYPSEYDRAATQYVVNKYQARQ